MRIWFNARFEAGAERLLREGLRRHELVEASRRETSVLAAGGPDPAIRGADAALGQPDAGDCISSAELKWVHLTTAGYARYDTDAVREAFRARGAVLSNSSAVFAEPAAQHALAMMLALGRNLVDAYRDQVGGRSWPFLELRSRSHLLTGSRVLILGYGAIARRLCELLAPFRCEVYALRRQSRSERGARIIREEDLTAVLPIIDHLVDTLPEGPSTRHWVNARRLSCLKPGARFYNIGRGSTVDPHALLSALQSGRLGAAYLDVTQTEPLPADDPLWSAPNCYLTPHTAGGRSDQDEALVRLFLENLEAFESGAELPSRVF